MVVKTYTFVGKSAICDLTSNWAPLKSVAGQRLYTIQRRSPVSATYLHLTELARKRPSFFSFLLLQLRFNVKLLSSS